MSEARPITIAILAMGGEGGGVLADWLVHVAEQADYLVQTTSVPGVAQRTGATIYYLEIFPHAAARAAGKMPVLALMPMPGATDIVIASELMEAGRAIQRGLVTPNCTTLIASTHRVYSMTEKIAMADGRVDTQALIDGCRLAARRFIDLDMVAIAERHHSVISAVLLGAIAASGALPFARSAFADAIRASGVSVDSSLAAFDESFAAASGEPTIAPSSTPPVLTKQTSSALAKKMAAWPWAEPRALALAGVQRTGVYQDHRYAALYLARLEPFVEMARNGTDAHIALLGEVARELALGMTYEDTLRVAAIKIAGDRFSRIAREAGSASGQILHIAEFMHPRVEEIADTLPASLGAWLLHTNWARRLVARVTRKGRVVRTSSLSGFLLLYMLAAFTPWRRSTLRFQREDAFVSAWLAKLASLAPSDPARALFVARLRGLVKGYGDTHTRGTANYFAILAALESRPLSLDQAEALRQAANADETGAALEAALRALQASQAA